ncbi:barstar family protein [Erwinia pyrifoliae]|uniref:Barstar family protein n=1 Tax=Erwinia pyrifoliae TaxID=79967 RepID=A0ABY5XCH2_ERWPY|nr:barstar family protein [Erwinia pyrifoliae]AUX72708.1 ribonuclease inhibitor [Erwinia pyrifoliae]MCA8877029.1 ribonuclease inhibitor [Erwinia pyrifoliae]MCT2387181.1 barstar family protein [Erwinia pyrifoliae]MCU8587219.1 barstar family protein [Erwinia pyrifoliae]UWS35125.1 barstar family protein [Erwinia pyrifoliae]
MQRVSFDLQRVEDCADFYRQFAIAFNLNFFGANQDALWDMLTGGVPLPLRITLRHLQGHPQQAELERIVAVMKEAEQETGGAFSVHISPR